VAKTLVLDRCFGITTGTNPVALYAFMALTNGLYLASHNAFRGLPRGAVAGNLFRSILSIPIAIGFNGAAGLALSSAGVPGVDHILQKWAAVISKAASDFVAGIIEGAADRYKNIRERWRDYQTKLEQLFDTYARMELRFPDVKVLELFETPSLFELGRDAEMDDFKRIIIINALDLMYFWMYQPRARSAFRSILRSLSREETRIVAGSQDVLKLHREISLMFVEGLVGKNFSRALSFYLDRSEEYLEALKRLLRRHGDRKRLPGRDAPGPGAVVYPEEPGVEAEAFTSSRGLTA
jgi:hypothetical protein